MDPLLQCLNRNPKYPVMVKSQGRYVVDREPVCGCGIISSPYLTLLDQGIISDSYHPLSRVSVDLREAAELFDIRSLQSGLLLKFSFSSGLGIFIHLDESSRECPTVLERLYTSLYQKY